MPRPVDEILKDVQVAEMIRLSDALHAAFGGRLVDCDDTVAGRLTDDPAERAALVRHMAQHRENQVHQG